MFGAHIIATDRVTKENDPIEVTGAMMITIMLFGAVMLLALLVLNVFQRDLPPIRAAIIYAFEPVWAGIASLTLGYDEIGFWFFVGAGALLIGNLVVELEGLTAPKEEE